MYILTWYFISRTTVKCTFYVCQQHVPVGRRFWAGTRTWNKTSKQSTTQHVAAVTLGGGTWGSDLFSVSSPSPFTQEVLCCHRCWPNTLTKQKLNKQIKKKLKKKMERKPGKGGSERNPDRTNTSGWDVWNSYASLIWTICTWTCLLHYTSEMLSLSLSRLCGLTFTGWGCYGLCVI